MIALSINVQQTTGMKSSEVIPHPYHSTPVVRGPQTPPGLFGEETEGEPQKALLAGIRKWEGNTPFKHIHNSFNIGNFPLVRCWIAKLSLL